MTSWHDCNMLSQRESEREEPPTAGALPQISHSRKSRTSCSGRHFKEVARTCRLPLQPWHAARELPPPLMRHNLPVHCHQLSVAPASPSPITALTYGWVADRTPPSCAVWAQRHHRRCTACISCRNLNISIHNLMRCSQGFSYIVSYSWTLPLQRPLNYKNLVCNSVHFRATISSLWPHACCFQMSLGWFEISTSISYSQVFI